MSRIPTIENNDATQNIASLYAAVQKKLGLVPNMVKTFAHSEAALQGYLGLSGAVSGGRLSSSIREKIALRVAERNACGYCLSAHTAIGGLLKIPAEALTEARRGESANEKEQAILNLTDAILETKGAVSDEAYEAARSAGVSTEEAVEIVANVALNVFTNYFNRFADTEIDFPKVDVCEEACCVTH